MNNWIGLIVSAIFTLSLLITVTLLDHFKIIRGEGARKFIHIVFCNWWFIAVFYFDTPFWAALVPMAFVIINFGSYRYKWLKPMERGGGPEDLGTVYYALSLFVLALWSFSMRQPWLGGFGIFIMGYGDGLAAVVGKYWGKRRILVNGHTVSLLGSSTLLIVSFLISIITLLHFQATLKMSAPDVYMLAFVLALSATLIESHTPLGLDNLTLPLTTSLFLDLIVEKKVFMLFSPLLMILALLGIALVSYAFHKNMLSGSGVMAALLLGGVLLLLGPPVVVLLMLLFFISSSLISKLSGRRARQRGFIGNLQRIHDKTDHRDASQVMANGGVALICTLLFAYSHSELYLYGCAAAFAAANADTWASEIGVLSKTSPSWLIKGTKVPRGLSGGVTWLGFGASAVGSCFIAAAFYGLYGLQSGYTVHLLTLSLLIALCGLLGALIDSLLGECLQAKYHVEQPADTGYVTEKSHNPINQQAYPLIGGLSWMNNNWVNFISSALAALFLMLLSSCLA